MQGLHTHTAMRHANLPLVLVWDHFLNMGGAIGHLEVDAYLHGMVTLPDADRDCVAQAVNELLDDRIRAGHIACCRAPYSSVGAFSGSRGASSSRACTVAGGSGTATTDRPDGWAGHGGRPAHQATPQVPVGRAVRRAR